MTIRSIRYENGLVFQKIQDVYRGVTPAGKSVTLPLRHDLDEYALSTGVKRDEGLPIVDFIEYEGGAVLSRTSNGYVGQLPGRYIVKLYQSHSLNDSYWLPVFPDPSMQELCKEVRETVDPAKLATPHLCMEAIISRFNN